MSEVENDAIAELSKKVMTVSKNVKLLHEMMETIDAKATEPKNSNEEKEKIDKIVEKLFRLY